MLRICVILEKFVPPPKISQISFNHSYSMSCLVFSLRQNAPELIVVHPKNHEHLKHLRKFWVMINQTGVQEIKRCTKSSQLMLTVVVLS